MILTISNLKGGVGKTTTAYTMAEYLRLKGFKVLLVDLDHQKNLTLLTGVSNPLTSYDILTNKNIKINDAITQDTIGASDRLTMIDNLLSQTIAKEQILKEALEPIKSNYDFIIIDTPPSLNTITINALTCSEGVIIPTQAELLSLEGIKKVYAVIQDIKKYCNPNINILGFLLVKYKGRRNIDRAFKDALEEQAKIYNTKVFKSTIRENSALLESQATKQNIFSYAPKSNGALDYTAFCEELLEELKAYE